MYNKDSQLFVRSDEKLSRSAETRASCVSEVSPEGVRHTGGVTLGGRSQFVPTRAAVSAVGNCVILPMSVFPVPIGITITSGSFVQDQYSVGCIDSVNKSGWMSSCDFFFTEHFIRHHQRFYCWIYYQGCARLKNNCRLDSSFNFRKPRLNFDSNKELTFFLDSTND